MDIISDIKFLKNSFNDIKEKASELNKEWKREMDKQKLINEMNKKIDELKNEFSEKIAALEEKKPYEISYPESGAEVYYFDDYTGDLEKRLFDKDDGYDKYLYEIGLYFQTEQQAEQFIKEQTLIKKIKCYAKEQQGDWQPNWEERTTKYFINILHDDRSVSVRRTIEFDVLPKLPHFKTEEIAQACIDEFGDEILEVFC
jgi:hypothetical protein